MRGPDLQTVMKLNHVTTYYIPIRSLLHASLTVVVFIRAFSHFVFSLNSEIIETIFGFNEEMSEL